MQHSRYLLCFLCITLLQILLMQSASSRPSLDNPDYSVTPWQPDPSDTLKTKFDVVLNDLAASPDTQSEHTIACDIWKKLYDTAHPSCVPPKTETPPLVEPYGFMGLGLGAGLGLDMTGSSTSTTAAEKSGANWESALVNGVADFLAERSKAEMRAWVTQKALDELCQEQTQAYFPTTCMYRKTYEYGSAAMEGLLVKGFRDDLKGLPAYLIWKTEQDSKSLDADWGYVMTNYFTSLRSGDYPLLLTASLTRTPAIVNPLVNNHVECARIPKSCFMYFSGLFAQTYYWSTHTKAAGSGKHSPMRFLASLYVTLHDAGREDLTSSLSKKLAKIIYNDQKLDSLQTSLKQKLQTLSNIERQIKTEIDQIKQAQDANKTDIILNRAARLTELTTKLTMSLDGFVNTLGLMDGGVYEKIKPSLTQIRQISHIAGYISSGNYSAAFGEFAIALNCLSGTNLGNCDEWKPDDQSKPALQAISANLPIIISLADAKSADDVKNILDDVASPVGSWRLKQKHDMTSVTSLVGFQASQEKLSGTGITSYTGSSGGMLAPLGLDMSWPTDDHHGSYGLLFSVLDFGNLVSARLSNKSTDQVANTQDETKLKNIVSIGVYFHRNFADSPMMWGVGLSYSPNLRQADLNNNQQVDVSSTRVSLFLAIDLTLFPL